MKILIALFVTLFSLLTYTHAQDRILSAYTENQTIKGTILSADQEIMHIRESDSDNIREVKIAQVRQCNFHDKYDEVIVTMVGIDTIPCRIQHIDKNKVYYEDESGREHNLFKSRILACFFGDNNREPLPENYFTFFKKYVVSHMSGNSNATLFKKNDERVDINFQGIEQDKIHLVHEELQTFLYKSDLKRLVFPHLQNPKKNTYRENYIVTTEGTYYQIEIHEVYEEKMQIGIIRSYDNIVQTTTDKQQIGYLYFYDFGAGLNENQEVDLKPVQRHSQFYIFGGYGHYFGEIQSELSGLEDYANDLRGGLMLGADLNFIRDKSGFGLAYNFFHTSNSIDNINNVMIDGQQITQIADNITYHFLGINLLAEQSLNSNVYNTVVLTPGIVLFRDNAEINNILVDVKGTAPGLSLSNRIGIQQGKVMGIYFQVGALLAWFNKLTAEARGTEIEEDVGEFDFRLEVGAGIRFNSE